MYKNLLKPFILLIFIILGKGGVVMLCAQSYDSVYTSVRIKRSDISSNMVLRDHGTCSYYDSAQVVSSDPPSFEWLENNGYCYNDDFGTNPDICWVLEPSGDSIEINAGNRSDCNNRSFSNLELYDSGCNLVGSGTNFTVTPGNTYYWCFEGSAWGGPDCDTGFTDFCPYYEEWTTLPVEMLKVEVTNKNEEYNLMKWKVASETYADEYIIQRSRESEVLDWKTVGKKDAKGATSQMTEYQFEDDHYPLGINYYRLVQRDLNGEKEYYGPIAIKNDHEKEIRKVLNVRGAEVDKDFKGPRILIYKDGTTEKVFGRE